MLRVMLEAPLVSSETRMFSIDCAVRAQLDQAPLKAIGATEEQLSKRFAGTFARLVQFANPVSSLLKELENVKLGTDVKALQFNIKP